MNSEDKQRLEEQALVIHHQSSDYDITGDNVYYPVNHRQLRELLGKQLTLLDAMNLPDRVHAAQKALIVQSTWAWWDEVYSNATTSYKGCIAPIMCKDEETTNDDRSYPSNRWGWESEDEFVREVLDTRDEAHKE